MQLDDTFWRERYTSGNTGWDLGAISTPLKDYIDQLADKDLEILVPGGGRSYEAEHLHRRGFGRVHVVDLTGEPFADLLERCPDFPRNHLHVADFFSHAGRYDRILEQTFFCALDPALRPRYVQHMHQLLVPGGKLVGVLFDDPLYTDHPPFGGEKATYLRLFTPVFPAVSLAPCHNSIGPRAGRELWLHAVREEPRAH